MFDEEDKEFNLPTEEDDLEEFENDDIEDDDDISLNL
jgi:hypothetical protein